VEPAEGVERRRRLPTPEDASEVECGAQRRGDQEAIQRHDVRLCEVARSSVDSGPSRRSLPAQGARLNGRQDVVLGVREDVDAVQPGRRAIADDVGRRDDQRNRRDAQLLGVLEVRVDVHTTDHPADGTFADQSAELLAAESDGVERV
jgi:hypothetical protein